MTDTELSSLLDDELHRQRTTLTFIASENYASRAVLAATGSVLTNKYSEGYPGKRYYGGNAVIDRIELLAIARAKQLFHVEHANVQPHSGSNANLAAYMALLKPGDAILAMDLAAGGHLTHGAKVNFSGQLYAVESYGVSRATELLDYDEIRVLAIRHKPKLIVAGASSYSRTIDFAAFRAIANEVGAKLLADIAHIAGLIAADVHPSPVPHADIVTFTTQKTLRGPRGGVILCNAALATPIDKAVMPGVQGGPLEHVIAAKAVCFAEAAEPSFADYQRRVLTNAKRLAAVLANTGCRIVSGGTDTHLFLVDLRTLGTTGKPAEEALARCGIVTNKNVIPFETRKPLDPSGLRFGTAAVTTRGLTEEDVTVLGEAIAAVLHAPDDEKVATAARSAVAELCERYPLYPDIT